jgi:hypothetical protein
MLFEHLDERSAAADEVDIGPGPSLDAGEVNGHVNTAVGVSTMLCDVDYP